MVLTKKDLDGIKQIVDETLDARVAPLVKDVSELKGDMSLVKKDVSELKSDMVLVKKDVGNLKVDMALVRQDITEIKQDLNGLREQIQSLTVTLDKFLKRLTDREEEFIILKSEVDKIKSFIKEKFGVEIAVQG
ncbi:hypothetical protein HYT01_01040 [Candidatus Giovannonibacteria bacterium]|nr:hypothetical protein [Candidatus Giovannonibacteria bacterium]